MIEITIECVGKDHLKQETGNLFDIIHETVLDIKEAQEFLIDRYGQLPKGLNKVFVDDKDGNSKVVGFTYSFWNKDISHNGKSWFQTDWITAAYIEKTPIDILSKNLCHAN
ncbi:MAG: hypothetical protein U9N86_17630 [Bacteroidota bacterium]|nr:hypothetical protein [Bacteroidota bacterium]